MQKLSVLVPVYNEVQTVESLVRRVHAVRFEIQREIIVVDDGSHDGSAERLAALEQEGLITLIRQKCNGGKGLAIREALGRATGDIVVVQDADLELDPADLPTLLAPILSGRADVCYGSRFLGGVSWSMRARPNYWANRVLNGLSNLLNGLSITDFNTCYKMMTVAAMRRLELVENGFAMEPEITGKLAALGYTILERPVSYRPRGRAGGKKIGLLDLYSYLGALIRYRARRPQSTEGVKPVSLKPNMGVRLGTNLD